MQHAEILPNKIIITENYIFFRLSGSMFLKFITTPFDKISYLIPSDTNISKSPNLVIESIASSTNLL